MKRSTWLALSALALCSLPALAQPARPDAGALLEQQQRPAPSLPQPGGDATVVLPPPPPPVARFDRSVRVLPTGFRIRGNTLFTDAQLQGAVANFIGQSTDMGGLLQATAAVRGYYRERGYLLTEAYLPQQQLPAAGGEVTIQVLEARVGRVAVQVEGGLSQAVAERIVHAHLRAGDAISEYALDRPILVLRDQAGFDATAQVTPGARAGEADVTVQVRPGGRRIEGSIGGDNYGARSAGRYRAWADASLNNVTGQGDVLMARLQLTDEEGSRLGRVGYAVGVGGLGTRIGLSAVRTEYALGGRFAALGATGEANVLGISLTHPVVRSRGNNVVAALTLERKDLEDITATPASVAERRVDAVRLGLMGNFVDDFIMSSFTSWGLHLAHGKLSMDAPSRAIDQAAGGYGTAGSFGKLNLDVTRTVSLAAGSRFVGALQAQLASKNLASAEKLSIGGLNGVRGYPMGEGAGDQGVILNLELQRQLHQLFGVPLAGSAFFDLGYVRYDVDRPVRATGRGSDTLHSAGLGLTAGNWGDWTVQAQVAWRTGSQRPASEPDKRPRLWLSVQKWL